MLSDDGLYSFGGFRDGVEFPGRWSLVDVAGAPTMVRVFILVSLVACLVVFLRPDGHLAVAGMVWMFAAVVSFNSRAPYALSAAEMYLAVLLFWALIAIFDRGSVLAQRLLRLQVAVVYAMPIVIRLSQGGDTWVDGSAVRLVVENATGHGGPLTSFVSHLPDVVLRAATWTTLVVESMIVVILVTLVVRPARVAPSVRCAARRIGVALHVAIALVCGLWFFSAVALVGLVACLGRDSESTGRKTVGFLATVMACCVLTWNGLSVSSSPAVSAGAQRTVAAYAVRGAGITQVWGVFSPNPPKTSRWIELVDDEGRVIVDSRRSGDRIRKLGQNVGSRPTGTLAQAWLSAECRPRGVTLVVVVEGSRAEAGRVGC